MTGAGLAGSGAGPSGPGGAPSGRPVPQDGAQPGSAADEAQPTTLVQRRPGRRRRPWVAALVALLVVGGGAGGWFWWDSHGPGSQRIVPALVHLSVADAQGALTGAGLSASVTEVFDEVEPRGQVVSATPASGATVRKGDSIALAVSKGPERFAVPAIVNLPRDAADQALTERTLTAGQVTEDFSETVPQGSVISQDPAPDTQVKRGTPVAYVVSKGRRPIDVPDVTGKPLAEAKQTLEALGLQVVEDPAVNSDTVAQGSVVSQQPPGGQLHQGDTVRLVPSKGPVLVAVPQVTGDTRAEATSKLQALGLRVAYENILGGIFGTVRDSKPKAGTLVPKGSTVTLVIV